MPGPFKDSKPKLSHGSDPIVRLEFRGTCVDPMTVNEIEIGEGAGAVEAGKTTKANRVPSLETNPTKRHCRSESPRLSGSRTSSLAAHIRILLLLRFKTSKKGLLVPGCGCWYRA